MTRPAVPDDIPAVAALERELFGAEAWPEHVLAGELESPTRWVAVVEEAGAVVAYAVVMVAGDLADLLRIGVRPDRRRAGLAGRLLEAGRDAARAAGAERLLLEVAADNAPALGLYAAHGFVPIDRRPRYYRGGADAVVLALELTRA